MKPYYEHAGITIYHADCREWLSGVPVCFRVDALVTDPPYGINFQGKETKHTDKDGIGYTVGDDGNIGAEVVRLVLPIVTRGAVFSGIRSLFRYPEPSDIGCVFCPSGAGIGPAGFTCFNPVLFYGPRAVNTLRPSSIVSFDTADNCGHPCPKPMRWMRWIVDFVSNPGEVVIDPFAGSGTTLAAAKHLGRKAVGIEIEERYCEIAAQRLSQEVLPLGLPASTA